MPVLSDNGIVNLYPYLQVQELGGTVLNSLYKHYFLFCIFSFCILYFYFGEVLVNLFENKYKSTWIYIKKTINTSFWNNYMV